MQFKRADGYLRQQIAAAGTDLLLTEAGSWSPLA
jgi:hypothetical protein